MSRSEILMIQQLLSLWCSIRHANLRRSVGGCEVCLACGRIMESDLRPADEYGLWELIRR